MKLADVVLVDTKTHLDLYVSKYGLNPKKGVLTYVGADNTIFFPVKKNPNTDVLFYGSYQPLQKVDAILKAAEKLPNVSFKLIGKGQTLEKNRKLAKKLQLKNVLFVDWVEISQLALEINKSIIMLGIFGESEKAGAVIPNKVYDALACAKPLITRDTAAVRELLQSRKTAILISDSNQLADAIQLLLKDKLLQQKISENGFKLYEKKLMPKKVVKELLNYL